MLTHTLSLSTAEERENASEVCRRKSEQENLLLSSCDARTCKLEQPRRRGRERKDWETVMKEQEREKGNENEFFA